MDRQLLVVPGDDHRVHSHPAGPGLATRYQVELFRDSTATTPLARSATSTIYVVLDFRTTSGTNCSGSVCHVALTWTVFAPPSALNTEISKQQYVYFGVNFAPNASAPRPTSIQLGADDPIVAAPHRISADEFEDSATFTFTFQAWHRAGFDTQAITRSLASA